MKPVGDVSVESVLFGLLTIGIGLSVVVKNSPVDLFGLLRIALYGKHELQLFCFLSDHPRTVQLDTQTPAQSLFGA